MNRALPVLFAERLGASVGELLNGFLDRCGPFFEDGSPAPLRRAAL